ncbi:MAG: dTDP-4-dehydrorhamnose 3,5-epimerase [Methanobacteriota archaeon]|nr:MAG: dTDP-4-dehydrorhamnose 3,5-epimerase [Euryarchaeota archaeon]
MEVTKTAFDGLVIIVPRIFEDNRGYFYESYNRETYNNAGIPYNFIQDNQSESLKGVIRGLHYQLSPHAQTKLVRAIAGSIFDVVVDLRKGSPTFGKWYGIELSDKNKLQLLVPQGFAHGFSVLSAKAIVHYKTDNLYRKEAERGIVYNDPLLGIDWKTDPEIGIVSERDAQLSRFTDAEYNFLF